MRELKFRAFIHPYCGGGIPQECYNTMDYSKNYELDDFFNLYKPHFFEVMQYTGLKDKNGKEIYEGDIVKPFTDDENIAQVIYRNGKFNIYSKKEDGSYVGWNYSRTEIEVLGNIHENPELI